jgi:hypothetical protein
VPKNPQGFRLGDFFIGIDESVAKTLLTAKSGYWDDKKIRNFVFSPQSRPLLESQEQSKVGWQM